MKLVKATNQSSVRRIRVKELGRIANTGEQFTVTDERYKILSGNNKYRVAFVTLVKNVEDVVVSKVDDKKPDPVEKEEKVVLPDIKVDEEPEIFVIEPGKEPVKVDENLDPIITDEPKPEKKKRGRKKKTTEEGE